MSYRLIEAWLICCSICVLYTRWRFWDFQFGDQWGGHGFGWEHWSETAIQVSYYELHYRRVREIRRQNNHTSQTVNRSKFNVNTQNMHAKKSIV